jgi:outer membrane protein OmpA-like peptidoglycan-associated protein
MESRTKLATIAPLALLMTAAGDASAQMIPRSVELDAFGGYYWFSGNLENFKSAPIVGGGFAVHFAEFVGAEASMGYVPSTTHHGNRVADYLAPHFNLVLHTTPWRVVPYLEVGAGFQSYTIREKFRGGNAPDGTELIRDPFATDEQVEAGSLRYGPKDIDFTFNAGGGVKFLIFERGGLRIDARYVLSAGQGGETDGVPAWQGSAAERTVVWNDVFHHVQLTGSFFVLLGGGARDPDDDGIVGKHDLCPDDPEDRDGFEDDDGCPELDNDKDGVADGEDQCPGVSEDRDGWRDADGCPDPDNDGDGLADLDDRCPDQPEDVDGWEDGDGCTDPDNDGDTIPDLRDRCPGESEDKDSFRDDDGCPDPDNDGDGIADLVDQCPDAPEEINGVNDKDGCPETDSDRDGVYDDRDRCGAEAEDLDGYQDDDGCPDLDNDGDGIPDRNDFCPMNPEDADGWEDGDGCPDADNDDDGLPDGRDQCPNKTEDDDGYEDDDGCPDFDNDQDGVLDGRDRCPNQPESFNGFQDEDGCPDDIPEQLKKFTGAIPDIQFKADSEELLPSSFPTLNEAANVLAQFKSVRIEIQGHASSEGDDAYNLDLSQRRADAVRAYLSARGVASDRLAAVGYGEAQPVDTNKTEAGRKRNRRVEFVIRQ